jgi:hypothetical protein
MNRIIKAGVWILVATVVVLPLYELADYTEVWQGDANIVLPALMFLLIGMALVGGKLVVVAVVTLIAAVAKICDLFTPHPFARRSLSKLATGPHQENLILILCDLRL